MSPNFTNIEADIEVRAKKQTKSKYILIYFL